MEERGRSDEEENEAWIYCRSFFFFFLDFSRNTGRITGLFMCYDIPKGMSFYYLLAIFFEVGRLGENVSNMTMGILYKRS